MKAVILCAGHGTRLRPLTHTGAKHLLPVANRPILFHVFDHLAEAGVDQACVVVAEGAQDLRQALDRAQEWDIEISYRVQESPEGLGHAVKIAQSFTGEDRFLVYLGDNLLEFGVGQFVKEANERECAGAVLLTQVADPRRFGVAQLDKAGRLRGVEEKPADPPSNLALTGVYMFEPCIYEAIDSIRPSPRGELEITDAIQHLISSGAEIAALEVSGWWRDTGRPEDVLDTNRLLIEALPAEQAVDPDTAVCQIEGRVYFENDCQIKDSLIRGPAIIGAGCHLEGSFVGPFTAVGRGCRLVNVEIENSILMPECRIEGAPFRIDSSILGTEVVMQRLDGRPAGTRLILGDHSQIWLS